MPILHHTAPDNHASNHGATGISTPAFSPLYQQIKGLILQSLEAGEWRPGELIPSEMELAGRFKVSQGTVRKAIDELAADNLVVRRQGKGTFVATHAEQQVQYRFLRLLPDQGDANEEGPAQRRIIECKRVRASADVARALALRTGDSVIQARRVLEFLSRDYMLNTFEASRFLDVYYCPARILELRNDGHNIITHWVTVQTEAGKLHRVGNYLLVREGQAQHAA